MTMTPLNQAIYLTQNLYQTMAVIYEHITLLRQMTESLSVTQTTTKVLPFVRKQNRLDKRQQFAQVAQYSDTLESGLALIAQHMAHCEQLVTLLNTIHMDAFAQADATLLAQHAQGIQLSIEAYYELEHTLGELSHHMREQLAQMKARLLPKA